MTRMLNRGNTPLIDATLARLELRRDSSYLDLGFGGGRALREAAGTVTAAPIYGVDFSPDVVAEGHRRFADLITAGRLTLMQGDVTDMPLRDGLFDRISTMNTIYFWPEPERAAAELFRLLTPGGRLGIGYTGEEKMASYPLISDGFTLVGAERVEALLRGAGFSNVRSDAVLEGDFVTLGERS
jgi:arsenite methyltransferase